MYGLHMLEKYGVSKRLFVALCSIYLFLVSFFMREGYRFLLLIPAMRTISCLELDRSLDEAKNLLCLWLIVAATIVFECCTYQILEFFPSYFSLRYFFFLYLIAAIDTLYFAYENLFKRLALNRLELLNQGK